VKYRPPENREPLPQEKEACRVWVNAELIFLKPKVIIPLGRHALETFLPDSQISLVHGQAFTHSSGIPIFAMYHPAVALYNPN
jgi:DNA polymerase